MSDVKVATKVDEKGNIGTDIDISKQAKMKKKSADANIAEKMAKLDEKMKKNQEDRSRALNLLEDEKLMMDKTLLALLQLFLLAFVKSKSKDALKEEIMKELQENEQLSKEYVISQMRNLLEQNQNLSEEQKTALFAKLDSPKLQDDIAAMANGKYKDDINNLRDFVQRKRREDSGITNSELTELIEKELKENVSYSTMSASGIIRSLIFKKPKTETQKADTTRVISEEQKNKKNSKHRGMV